MAASARLSPEYPDDTHVVILSVADEQALLIWETKLLAAGYRLATFREPDPPFGGAATGLGIEAQPRKYLRKLLSGLPLVKERP